MPCPAHDSANDQNDLICLALGDVVNDQVGLAGDRSSLWSSFVNWIPQMHNLHTLEYVPADSCFQEIIMGVQEKNFDW